MRKIWIPKTLAYILREWKKSQDNLKEMLGEEFIDYNLVITLPNGRPCEGKLIEESFYQKTYLQTQIMGRALMESIRFMDGRCIVSMVDRKTMEFYNAVPGDLDGIVNQLRNIKGVDCAIFMYETNVLEYKVSMRSNENVDVAKVAAFFGGGGHVRAAGCTMKGTFHDCVNNLSLHIDKQLRGEQD